ncbi:hypothetical protein HY488_00815, partial [Candidatus Woesearchaeota archaeon]|nr:hypothetical protein [Candidatus Woesearchaeota archaeon]
PDGWESDYATLLVGVDTLLGGNIGSPSGVDHVLLDSWTSNYALPPIYHDPRSKALREHGGVSEKTSSELVSSYVRDYYLDTLADSISDKIENLDTDDFGNIMNTARAADVMLQTMCAIAEKRPLPSYLIRRAAATNRNEFDLRGYHTDREELRERLARAGYEVTQSRPLRETYLAWEKTQPIVPTELVQAKAYELIGELLQLTREKIFSKLDFSATGYSHDLHDVAFDGIEFKTVKDVFFTMSMAYRGGEKDGRPALTAVYEYNTDIPLTPLFFRFLIGHEAVPGHYLNNAIIDLLSNHGTRPLGFEATIGTMCTPSTIFQEGWGNIGLELLFGGREKAIDALGQDYGVYAANHDLQDIAKHYVSILFQVQGKSLDEIKRFVAEDCAQSDAIVDKMSRAWATHPIIGPMYGPAYYMGTKVLRKAIKDKGAEAVARVGLHLEGLVDIVTFQDKLYRNPTSCSTCI